MDRSQFLALVMLEEASINPVAGCGGCACLPLLAITPLELKRLFKGSQGGPANWPTLGCKPERRCRSPVPATLAII
jgi:hypothetical protein